MKITKFGHCCLLLEVDGVRLLTDPGNLSQGEGALRDLDAIIITHEHADHFHVPSLKGILANNPQTVVISNGAVGALLAKENILFTKVANGESTTIKGVTVSGYGTQHAIIYDKFGARENTGFMVAGTFFFPGDNFYNPGVPVDILALPMAGPWMKLSEAIDYAKTVKPRVTFPVHDGIYRADFGPAFVTRMGETLLDSIGIKFVGLNAGETKEF